MALEDYDPTGFFGSPNQFLSPAMGKMFAQNPEAMIPHLAANNIGPPGPQFAENFAGRFGAINDAIPPSGALPAPSPYAPPAAQPSQTPFVPSEIPSYGSGQTGGIARAIEAWGSRQVPGANGLPPKAPDKITPSLPGRVPPEALNKPQEDTGDLRTEAPYTPPKQVDVVNPDGSPATTQASAAPGTPQAAAAAMAAPAKSTPMSPELRKMIDAISGVRPPPAPPTPVLHPEVGKAAAPMAGSPIASMLAEILSGKGLSTNTLRLLQAVGK